MISMTDDEKVVRDFIECSLELHSGVLTPTNDVYKKYCKYCKDRNIARMELMFVSRIIKKVWPGLKVVLKHGIRYYKDIRVNEGEKNMSLFNGNDLGMSKAYDEFFGKEESSKKEEVIPKEEEPEKDPTLINTDIAVYAILADSDVPGKSIFVAAFSFIKDCKKFLQKRYENKYGVDNVDIIITPQLAETGDTSSRREYLFRVVIDEPENSVLDEVVSREIVYYVTQINITQFHIQYNHTVEVDFDHTI